MAVVSFRIGSWWMLAVALAVGGCAELGQPPVVERSPVFSEKPASYLVHAGDTLYSIAWRFNIDFKALARLNRLNPPYIIRPGQRVRLSGASQGVSVRAGKPAKPRKSEPVSGARNLRWEWPTDAMVSREYGRGNSGMDFALGSRRSVRAAAAGIVVYAGNGLGGFSHLTIIKHNDTYLSAYSLNHRSVVREGDSIKAGEQIADIQGTGRTAQTLHFEVRKQGEPVNPRSVIRQ